MKLNIGLIGLGSAWQSRHRPALRMLHDRFDVRAVYTPVSKLAESCATEFQADLVDGYRALVRRGDVDAVMVLDRAWTGWLPALAACEAGKAVYWASDFDFDLERDRHVRQRIDDSGVAFVTEFPRRCSPATLRLKELMATRLGAPKLVFCHRLVDHDDPPNGRSRRDRSVAVRQELIEAIDWCRYVVGRSPDSVTASAMDGIDAGDQPSDYQAMSLRFGGGPPGVSMDGSGTSEALPAVTAQVSCGSYLPPQWPEAAGFRPPSSMQICCQRGVAFLDLPSSLVWFDEAGRHLESLDAEPPVGEQLLCQFHRAVTSLVRDMQGLDDAFDAAGVLAAARKSWLHGRRIDLATR